MLCVGQTVLIWCIIISYHCILFVWLKYTKKQSWQFCHDCFFGVKCYIFKNPYSVYKKMKKEAEYG
ncbi:MAG TPA: hypothetical protein DEB74_11090 [Lachnospiraceae bacterium]|nr:hypothetical protein [Lachnospiraceae bacterium]